MNPVTGKVMSPKQFVDMSEVPTNSIKVITPKSLKQLSAIKNNLKSSSDLIKTDCAGAGSSDAEIELRKLQLAKREDHLEKLHFEAKVAGKEAAEKKKSLDLQAKSMKEEAVASAKKEAKEKEAAREKISSELREKSNK